MSGDESANLEDIAPVAFIRKPLSTEHVLGVIERISESTDLDPSRLAQLANRERMATLGLLTASVAHEISNPIAVICGSLDLLGTSIRDLTEQGGANLDLLAGDLRDARAAADLCAGDRSELRQRLEPAHSGHHHVEQDRGEFLASRQIERLRIRNGDHQL